MDEAQDQQVMVIPLLIPALAFKILNEAAIKKGMTVSQFVSASIQKQVQEIQGENSNEGG